MFSVIGFRNIDQGTKFEFTNKSLPLEVSLVIFSHLNSIQLQRCFVVNKTWSKLASNKNLWNAVILREKAFGKKQWETYFGEIGKEPPLPNDIYQILKSPCPFFAGKKVKESHVLVLIPETVNGKPLTVTSLEELVKAPKEGNATKYRYIWDAIINDKEISQATVKSHWALMTKDVIPGSGKKSYADQKKMIAERAKQTGLNYEIPNLRDATICICTNHTISGERLFSDDPYTYTRCQENIQSYQVVVGGFFSSGLDLYCSSDDDALFGAAALLRFLC